MRISPLSKRRLVNRYKRRLNIDSICDYINHLPDVSAANFVPFDEPMIQGDEHVNDSSNNMPQNQPEERNSELIVRQDPNFVEYSEVLLMAILSHGNLTLKSATKFVNIMNNLIARFLNRNLKLPSVRALWEKQARESLVRIYIICPNDHLHGPFTGEPKFFGSYTCLNQSFKAEIIQGNHFIQIPLRNQLLKYLPLIKDSMWRDGIWDNIDENFLFDQCEIPVVKLTMTLHADEVMAFNSSSTKIFPIFASINELKPRFKNRYFFLLALFVGSTKPSVKNYLKPLCDEFKNLAENPISWESSNKIQMKTTIYVSAVIADAPMRAYLRHVRQYNHLQGCDWCLIQASSAHGARVYPNIDSSDASRLKRKHNDFKQYESFINSNVSSHLENQRFNGITGVSPLLNLPKFNIVDGFAVEPMHSIVLGVFRSLINREWLQASSNSSVFQRNVDKNFFRRELSQRITQIKVPSHFVRPPRSLDHIKFWKSNELDSFLCYYILCSSRGLFQARYLNHLMSLIKIYHLTHVDSQDKIQEIKELVNEFQTGMAILYGSHMLTYNLHILSHLADSCKYLGLTSCFSSYPLEHKMGILKNSVRRASNVAPSLVRIFMSKFKFDDILISRVKSWNLTPQELMDFGTSEESLTATDGLLQSIPFITKIISKSQSNQVKEKIVSTFEQLSDRQLLENQIELYDSIKIDGKRFSTRDYAGEKRRDDSFIKIDEDQFMQIEHIYATVGESNSYHAYGKLIKTKPFKFSYSGFTKKVDINLSYLHTVHPESEESFVSTRLSRKVMHVVFIKSTVYFYTYKNDFIIEPFLVNY